MAYVVSRPKRVLIMEEKQLFFFLSIGLNDQVEVFVKTES